MQWRGEESPVGLEVERGTEAVEFGMAVSFGGEAFHLHQVEAIEAVLLGELAPESGGGAGIQGRLKVRHKDLCAAKLGLVLTGLLLSFGPAC